jgi:6-phosphogluconolactonase (cycloisomerase 2 family)
MMRASKSWLWRAAALLAGILAVSGFAIASPPYVITNDDPGVTFYAVAPDGMLSLQQQLQIGGFGTPAGFFGADRISVLNSGGQQCVYASISSTATVVGIAISTLTVGGSATGSPTDGGTSNGIGLAMNSKYLYASFTDSNTIGTFQVISGCGVAFINDVAVSGLAGGIVNGMAIHGNMLIATYTDGTIESFDISAGTPTSHGDKQYSTATLTSQDATYPNSIDITSDGHFAIFGDTSTRQVVEVSDVSSGKLTKTVVHATKASISASNIMLSPDETLLYVINTQGASVSAINFDKATGALSGGCTSGKIRGVSANWSYLAGLGLISTSGNGGGVYVAEFGGPSAIAMVSLTTTGDKCSLQEVKKSPFADPNSQGLLSIDTFPPRSF